MRKPRMNCLTVPASILYIQVAISNQHCGWDSQERAMNLYSSYFAFRYRFSLRGSGPAKRAQAR